MGDNSTSYSCLQPIVPNPHGGPQSDFVHYVKFQPITIGVETALLVITCTFVFLRLWASLKQSHRLFVDDYLTIAALCLAFAGMILDILAKVGFGHAWDMNPCQILVPLRTRRTIAEILLYYPTLFVAKAALCGLYLRLFESIRWIRITVWSTITTFGVVCALVTSIAFSNYVKKHWSNRVQGGIEMGPLLGLFGAATILMDFVLMVIPIRPITKMTLSKKKKFGLLAVFLIGGFATAISMGLTAMTMYYYYFFVPNSALGDWTWIDGVDDLLSITEVFIVITLGCVPGVVAAWRHILRDTSAVKKLYALLGLHHTAGGGDDEKMGQEDGKDEFKVRNNDRTMELEMIEVSLPNSGTRQVGADERV